LDPPHNQGCQSAPGLLYGFVGESFFEPSFATQWGMVQDVLHGFSNSKKKIRHAFSILHLWKKTISSRSMISHDIDTLDFSGQRGCHSLICKIGHIPKKDKGDIKGLLQLRNISRAIHAYTTYRESRWTHVQANGIKKSWVQYDSKFGWQRKKDH